MLHEGHLHSPGFERSFDRWRPTSISSVSCADTPAWPARDDEAKQRANAANMCLYVNPWVAIIACRGESIEVSNSPTRRVHRQSADAIPGGAGWGGRARPPRGECTLPRGTHPRPYVAALKRRLVKGN